MSYKRALERANADLEAIRTFVNNLTKAYEWPKDHPWAEVKSTVIEELLRRGEGKAARDGYPATDMGSETRGKGTHADPTEAAATDDAETRDLIGDALVEILSGLTRAADELADVNQARSFVLSIQGKNYGHANTVEKCYLCELPIIIEPGKVCVRRIDGKPHHATSCYYRARRARGETTDVGPDETVDDEPEATAC